MEESVDIATDVALPGASMRQFLAGLLVASLVAGAWFLTADSGNQPYPNAGQYIADLHAQGPEAVAAKVPVEILDHFEVPVESRLQIFEGMTTTPIVESENAITVVGVPLIEVITDTGSWCVRPDGMVLPNCLYGFYDIVSLDADTEIEVFQVDPLAVRQPVAAVFLLRQPDAEQRVLTGDATLVDDTKVWLLRAVDAVVGGQLGEPAANGIPFGGPQELGVQLEGQVGPDQALPPNPIELVFEDERFLVAARATYWLR